MIAPPCDLAPRAPDTGAMPAAAGHGACCGWEQSGLCAAPKSAAPQRARRAHPCGGDVLLRVDSLAAPCRRNARSRDTAPLCYDVGGRFGFRGPSEDEETEYRRLGNLDPEDRDEKLKLGFNAIWAVWLMVQITALAIATPAVARAHGHAAKGGYGDFEQLQPCKSDYTTTQNTYQTCPKRPR